MNNFFYLFFLFNSKTLIFKKSEYFGIPWNTGGVYE
jgi:hypothetical protein